MNGRAPEPCIEGRCYSPIACGGWGYCRERNEGRAASKEQIVERRHLADCARKRALPDMREILAESFARAPYDSRPDGTGLDDGPYLPGHAPRKKAAPKPAHEVADIRARAWNTRRAKYGDRGHR